MNVDVVNSWENLSVNRTAYASKVWTFSVIICLYQKILKDKQSFWKGYKLLIDENYWQTVSI